MYLSYLSLYLVYNDYLIDILLKLNQKLLKKYVNRYRLKQIDDYIILLLIVYGYSNTAIDILTRCFGTNVFGIIIFLSMYLFIFYINSFFTFLM